MAIGWTFFDAQSQSVKKSKPPKRTVDVIHLDLFKINRVGGQNGGGEKLFTREAVLPGFIG